MHTIATVHLHPRAVEHLLRVRALHRATVLERYACDLATYRRHEPALRAWFDARALRSEWEAA